MWRVEFLNAAVAEELGALEVTQKAKFARIVELIERFGLQHVGEPYVKPIEGKLWEIRLKGRTGIARSLYITAQGRRVVILRTFVKTSQKTPRREIELALKRAEELK